MPRTHAVARRAAVLAALLAIPAAADTTVTSKSVTFFAEPVSADPICATIAKSDSDSVRGAEINYNHCVTYQPLATPLSCDQIFCTYDCSYTITVDDNPAGCPNEVCQSSGITVGNLTPGVPNGDAPNRGVPGQLGYGRYCHHNFDEVCAPDLTTFFAEEAILVTACEGAGFLGLGIACGLFLADQECPPGPETEHWTHVVPSDVITTVSGIVAGGAGYKNASPGYVEDGVCAHGLDCAIPTLPTSRTPATCHDPDVSGNDLAMQHYDRDFEFPLIPLANGGVDSRYMTTANLRAKRGGGFPAIAVETEFMLLYPDQATSPMGSKQLLDVNGTPFSLPPQYSHPAGLMHFPVVGDYATVQGMLIWDCGHPTVLDGLAYETEIHPAVSMAWMHGSGNHTANLAVKAMSHTPYPSGAMTAFRNIDTAFDMPGYDPGLPLCIGQPVMDYNKVITNVVRHHDSKIQSSYPDYQDPWANATVSANYPLSLWTIQTWWSNQRVSFSVSPKFDAMPGQFFPQVSIVPWDGSPRITVSRDQPFLMGAHIPVCQPVKDFNGNVTNGCTGQCTPSAIPAPQLSAALDTTRVSVTTGASYVNLKWSAGGGGLYGLYRTTNPNAVFPSGFTARPIAAGGYDTLSYGDEVSYNTTYYYLITDRNPANPIASNLVSITTPAAPVTSVTSVGTHHVTLAWTAVPNAQSYTVYRTSYSWLGSPTVHPPAMVTTTTALTYQDATADTSCDGHCPYAYWVRALMADGTVSGYNIVQPWPLRVPLIAPAPNGASVKPDGIHVAVDMDPAVPNPTSTDLKLNPYRQGSYLVTGPGGVTRSSQFNYDSGPFSGTAGVQACFTAHAQGPAKTVRLSPLTQSDETGPMCVVPFVPKNPVTGLSTSPSGNSVFAIWNKSLEANSYRVYVNGALAATPTDFTYTTPPAPSGTTYSIQVSPGNVFGFGPMSAPVSGAVTCNSTSCASGCCDANGLCVTSHANTACGTGAAACFSCGAGMRCDPRGICISDFDCSSCACGCTGTSCVRPPLCGASCAKAGGTCDVCSGCVF